MATYLRPRFVRTMIRVVHGAQSYGPVVVEFRALEEK